MAHSGWHDDLCFLTATEAIVAFRARRLSPAEMAAACIEEGDLSGSDALARVLAIIFGLSEVSKQIERLKTSASTIEAR
jgi:hypothetical protein